MELPPSASFLAAVLATALCFLLPIIHRRRSRRSHRKYNLPPGPRAWPVIGNLNLIGPLPHRSVHKLSKRHGPLMSLRLGSMPAVVGASVDVARLLLRTHDLALIDRPRTASGRYTGYDYSDMLWSPYGAYWLQARRLWKAEVFSAPRLRSHERVRDDEVRAMLRGLYDGPAAAGRAVVLIDHLFTVNINVISLMVLGRKYAVGDDGAGSAPTTPEEFKWMIEEFFFLSAPLRNIGDVIPLLNWLDPRGYIGRMKKLRKMFDRFLEHVLDEHNERRRREGEKFVATDMVDLLLELADNPNLEVPIERDGVKAFTLNLLVGLPDTTSVTVEWAMSELLRNPDVLAKATEELDRVIGRERHVTEGDIPNLPYIEVIVKETMRLHPVSPLLAPRLSREDVSVGGHDIPAGTLVFVNVWAIARDPAVWGKDASEFRPERLVGSGVDVKGHDFELLPFGSGRRMCPGISLGLKMVQVILANLLHGYAWRLPDGVAREELSMEEKFGLSMPRKVPLEAVAEPRLPAHLYAGP
ncbi:Flavonoid 3'-monooxygenase [Dichanthelium oligosanthes]|uniref:Flavonoid 3'-monooxygenase n=1 Tax=Dichanthelium oligosanthes TaxID=888268 RepID=A0A1E5WAF9_9POAL|nr:Flavonoid 3'-monooxygenase [Dichanthelium oligosanthes]